MEKLRRAVKVNSVFSEFTGVVALAGAWVLDERLGVGSWLLAALGTSLLGYGAWLWWIAAQPDPRRGAGLATIMDSSWVLGAAVIVIGFPAAMTAAGRIALVTVSLIVGALAVAQYRSLNEANDVLAMAGDPATN